MILKIPFICIFIFYTSMSMATVQNDDFFNKHYQEINQNIKQKRYEDNLQLIENLVKQKGYKMLDCYYKGKISHKIGVSYYLLNRESEAIAYFKEEVLNTWENCAKVPPSERANTIYNIGVSYQYLNDIETAKLYLDEALYIFENDTLYSSYKLANKYHGIGKFYKNKNDLFRAELYFKNAINLYKQQDNTKAKQFEVFNNLIAMSKEFKEYEKAKKYIDEALSIHENFPETIPKLNLAWVYLNAGTTHLELKEYKTAKQMAQKGLNLLTNENKPYYFAIGLELMAMIYLEEEKFNLAEKNLMRSLDIRNTMIEKGESKLSIVHAYENLSDIFIRKGDIEKGNHNLNKAFDILVPNASFDKEHLPIIKTSKSLDNKHLIRLIELKIKIFKDKYKRSKDIKFLKQALSTQHKIDSVINRSLVSFQFEQSKLDFLNLKFEHYGKAIEDALELHRITGDPFYLKEAYYFSSKTKAIVLQYELNQADAFQSNVSPEIVKHEQDLRAEMHAQQVLLSEATDDKDSLLQVYTKAQYALDSYLKEIEQKEPTYFKEKYTFIRPPKLKDIQGDLPSNMAVVEYFLSENNIYSFWLTKNDFFSITTPYDPTIIKALDNFIAQCHDPKSEVSEKLSQLIFERCLKKGIKKIGKDIKRLCIIPDGQLHKLSFEALIDSDNKTKKYLIEDYTISYSYSVALLFRKQNSSFLESYIGFSSRYSGQLNQKLKARKRFFGSENLMQLVLSDEEIKRGAAIFDGEMYIDNEASLENFLKHSSDADIIHLSLHGLVDLDDPGRSCILFDDNQKEFILSAQNLYGNRLNADLVLLSTCHSASGKIYSGEGVQGMSKSFLLGGAHNIMSSLWNATEASSIAITTSFLENIHDGLPKDLALHQSKLDYLSRTEPNKKHPYYWANFILLGEIDKTKESISPTIWIVIVGLFVLFFFIWHYSKRLK
ncbi:CHAT domain-containing protein [Aquimarina algiphila]|uniref:CHAT domain-containing protein n=2 Tax=Aquimarina algiphila TaxID=2047982 RepID=A0A554VPA3_9FLAO|nr:CHAT domain-containing protein [Aquimarina algiphila]